MEIINETAAKFKDKQGELCDFLFELLRRINALEKEIFERSEELKRKKEELGIPKNQVGPGEEELWEEYERRLGEIVKPVCTDKLLKKRYGGSYGNPPKYAYIDGGCKANFIMKTSKKAVVETHFSQGGFQLHKFVLKEADGKWLVDEVYYGFDSNPEKWYADSIR